MEDSDAPPNRPPPPPPPKRLSRPKITLQIPESITIMAPKTARAPQPNAMYWGPGPMRFPGKPPGTAGSHISDPHGNPYFNPFEHMYHNKASDFMFKQFEGFKDFTMTTAKSGLSIGEKSAFWFYNKLRAWSRKWFTHLFLTLCLVLYSVMGAAIFMALEGAEEDKFEMNITQVRREFAMKIESVWQKEAFLKNEATVIDRIEAFIREYEDNYTECTKVSCFDSSRKKKTWGFMNAMFYAGTIYTTIG